MREVSLTASAIISFAQELEDGSMRFYEELAERFGEQRETFLAFAKGSKKNGVLVIRTYRETISDALEACFGFEGLNLRDYSVEMGLADGVGYSDALRIAIELEEVAGRFYLDAADRSQSLLATIPRAFRTVAKKRGKRKLRLQTLHDAVTAQP